MKPNTIHKPAKQEVTTGYAGTVSAPNGVGPSTAKVVPQPTAKK